MASDALLLVGTVGAVAGVAALRLSWGRPQRSPPLNVAGWLLLGTAVAAGWVSAGAWGATVVSLWAMGAAFLVLVQAAWKSPPAKRSASNRRAGVLPEDGEPARIGRRIATFLIVTLAGLVSTLALAVAARWFALLCGTSEADANVIGLFAAPIGWTILTFLLLMSQNRQRQFIMLVVPVAAALPAFVTGSIL